MVKSLRTKRVATVRTVPIASVMGAFGTNPAITKQIKDMTATVTA